MAVEDFLLNTDYPLDKVLNTFSGSFSVAARISSFQPRYADNPIDHDIGDWAFINGVYSTDNITWLPFGVVNAETSGSTPSYQTVEVSAYCTTTQVVVIASNYLASSQTIYYALQLISRE